MTPTEQIWVQSTFVEQIYEELLCAAIYTQRIRGPKIFFLRMQIVPTVNMIAQQLPVSDRKASKNTSQCILNLGSDSRQGLITIYVSKQRVLQSCKQSNDPYWKLCHTS